ncbi:MAG: toll/interleukin-1 receptor domain-containing protein, partial [Lachnospiraceae bacterium]|nr:toll/interleukin-1 receptor domain-containing protein [Lachnospiraceae bacterium]
MNNNMNPRPYEGKEKYIFISYSHKDTDRVMPIISRLMNEGFRVWYDDGISPGTEWP